MKYLSTGEFASLCRTRKDTLLFYDKEGLLKPRLVSENGYRRYHIGQFYEFDMVAMLKESLRRFPTGTYMVWYPKLHSMQSRELPEKLKRLPDTKWLHVSMDVHKPADDGFGMHGSGLFIINPPWTLPATLKKVMPWLVEVLGQDEGASFKLEFEIA